MPMAIRLAPEIEWPLEYTGGGGTFTVAGGDTTTCWALFFNSTNGPLNAPPPGINGQLFLCDTNMLSLPPGTDGDRAIKNDCPQVGSSITLTIPQSDGTNQQITSNPDGTFSLPSLLAGTYQIHADGPTGNTGLVAFCLEIGGAFRH